MFCECVQSEIIIPIIYFHLYIGPAQGSFETIFGLGSYIIIAAYFAGGATESFCGLVNFMSIKSFLCMVSRNLFISACNDIMFGLSISCTATIFATMGQSQI
jgi:hypothetical protein